VQVEALEPLGLKGKSEHVAAFRLLDVDPVASGVARHLDAALVGRERELRLLREAWERVLSESGCHLFTLLGVAGVGKSRLVEELLGAIGDEAVVLRGRCLSYGEGITFWPLAEAFARLGDRAAQVLERLSAGGAALPQELFWEVRRFLESLAAERPVVLQVDDLQWAEQMLLDLLDHLVDLSRGAPILVLCTARPELLEERPNWGGGKLNAQAVLLEPLAAQESLELLERLGDGLGEAARRSVIAASEGNPLFLEEMAALARESGEVAVPATIRALLTARLERLGSAERELLERGAVEGEVFHRLAVRALADGGLADQVDQRLAGLVRRELIRPHPATFPGDEAYRFRHLLIRDAAYDALPKTTRARLHEAFADWLERAAGDLPELDDIAGWHLERAVRYRQELAQPTEERLTERAAEHLRSAGQRACERSDPLAARSLLERALGLAGRDDQRADIAVLLAQQLIETGDFPRADDLLATAERHPLTAAHAAVTRFELLLRTKPEASIELLEDRLPSIIDEFESSGDELGIARAHLVKCGFDWLGSRAQAAGEHALKAAEHARRASDEGLRQRALASYFSALHYGDANIDVLRSELMAFETQNPGPFLSICLDTARGSCAELDGNLKTAGELVRRAIDKAAAIGMPTYAGGFHQNLGSIALLEGRAEEARATLQCGDEILASMGERSVRSTVQAVLAEANLELADHAATRAAVELAEELSAPEDLINYAFTHAVRARLALSEGEPDAAERWARSSVQYAYETDFYRPRAGSRLALSRVLAAQGHREEAEANGRAALDIYSCKGDKPRGAQARRSLDTLGAQDAALTPTDASSSAG
jgi:tetratricopeptide (TPR) repeat protein